jgi:hypothetical protein
MRHLLLLSICIFFTESSLSADTQLKVRVKIKVSESAPATAFAGVGDFEIFRGDTKFSDARCPEPSDNEGGLVCEIKCETGVQSVKALRVVPPGKTRKVRGYIAPPAIELRLANCKLSPGEEREFIYLDPRVALAELTRAHPAITKIASVNPAGAVMVYTSDDSIAALETLGETQNGRLALTRLQEYVSAAADAPNLPMYGDSIAASNALPNAIASVYFKQAVKEKAGIEISSKVKVDFTEKTYFGNISKIQKSLDTKTTRTPKENLLLNDLHDWKKTPATAAAKQHSTVFKIP